jgi:hypothetical protein
MFPLVNPTADIGEFTTRIVAGLRVLGGPIMKMLFCAVAIAMVWSPAIAQQTVAGDWMLTIQELSGPNIMRFTLTVDGDKVTGTALGRAAEGTMRGSALKLKNENVTFKGQLEGGALKGEAIFQDRTVPWTAVRVPPRPPQPKTHVFEPTAFHLYFSSKIEPVLHIHPGDTVRTWNVTTRSARGPRSTCPPAMGAGCGGTPCT